jgi:hypothetical protein
LLFKKKEYRKQIKIFQEENNFLKEKCKMLEEKHDELFKENHILSENFMKLNEELELYKSIFLVKNLEIKFKQKKENFIKSKSSLQKASDEKWINIKPKNMDMEKKQNDPFENFHLNFNLKEKEEEALPKKVGDLLAKHVLTLYEKFGVLFLCFFFP